MPHKLTWALILTLVLAASQAFSQSVKISGKIVDATTQSPIPYASIGVLGKSIGTVANSSGEFVLPVKQDQLTANDKLAFSCVGYESAELQIGDVKKGNLLIKLKPQVVEIEEVKVLANKLKKKVLGKNDREYFTHYNFYSMQDTAAHDRLGREVGNIIKLNHTCFLNDFNVYMGWSDFTSVKFRVNVYEVVNGLPGKSLLQENIIFEVKGKNPGWVKVDLKEYNIRLEGHDKVAVTVQWLESVKQKESNRFLSVPIAVSPVHAYVTRDKSTGEWKRGLGYLSMYLNADCFKPESNASVKAQ